MAKAAPGYLGPYRLLNVIHSGQAVKIWQAYHDGKQRRFALKTLNENFRRDKEQLGYLKLEAAVGKAVKHQRIIKVFELDSDRGVPYLVLEWFPAHNLKRQLGQGPARIAHLASKIIDQGADALGYFNSCGYIHRDIKPENFLVSNEGEVKLIDFGLAQKEKGGLGRLFARKTKVQGTRSYMAPEQIRGETLTTSADVYSFGCVVHELIAGTPPFTGVTTNELLNKHLKAQPPSLDRMNENVTPDFAKLVKSCLAKDPGARPDSVDAFLMQFRSIRVFRVEPKPPAAPALPS